MARHLDDCPARRPHDDAGLQPERTSLAWGRTSLALLVVACFFMRWMRWHGWLGGALALLCLFAALYIWVTQRRRYRLSASGIRTGLLRADVASVLFIGGVVACLAVSSAWAVLGAG
ncbi:hypothetical protein D9M69_242750 [compost metagenome]